MAVRESPGASRLVDYDWDPDDGLSEPGSPRPEDGPWFRLDGVDLDAPTVLVDEIQRRVPGSNVDAVTLDLGVFDDAGLVWRFGVYSPVQSFQVRQPAPTAPSWRSWSEAGRSCARSASLSSRCSWSSGCWSSGPGCVVLEPTPVITDTNDDLRRIVWRASVQSDGVVAVAIDLEFRNDDERNIGFTLPGGAQQVRVDGRPVLVSDFSDGPVGTFRGVASISYGSPAPCSASPTARARRPDHVPGPHLLHRPGRHRGPGRAVMARGFRARRLRSSSRRCTTSGRKGSFCWTDGRSGAVHQRGVSLARRHDVGSLTRVGHRGRSRD